jgi:hypothetical protein
MTDPHDSDERFRQLALAEGGMPVSAGARLGHIAEAKKSGRVVELDLSEVPDEDRPELISTIRSLIGQASRPNSNPVVANSRH